MAYSEKVVDHYSNPRNVGSMDKNDPNVGTGMVGAPECGDVMKLQIKVDPVSGLIEDAKFKPLDRKMQFGPAMQQQPKRTSRRLTSRSLFQSLHQC